MSAEPTPNTLAWRAGDAARRAEAGDASAWNECARLWRHAGDRSRAQRALERSPLHADADRERALLALDRGEMDEARRLAPPGTDAELLVQVATGAAPAVASSAPDGDPERDLARALARLVSEDLRGAATLAANFGRSSDALVRARALTIVGRALVDLRDYPRASAAHDAALKLHRTIGCPAGVTASVGGLGLCDLGTGHGLTARGASRLANAVALAAAQEDAAAEAAWRTHYDHALSILQRTEQRIVELVRFREIVRQLGDAAWEATLWETEASCRTELKDHPGAARCRAEAQGLRQVLAG